MKIVGKTKSKVMLGSGKELKEKSKLLYTIVRDGLRMENTQFADLKLGDSVLCWTEESVQIE